MNQKLLVMNKLRLKWCQLNKFYQKLNSKEPINHLL